MRMRVVAVLALLVIAQATFALPMKIVNPSFDEGKAGWRLTKGFRVEKGAGHNGSGGLVWESRGPSAAQDTAVQTVPLKVGTAYECTALVRTVNFKGAWNGAAICVCWFNADGKWMGETHEKGVLDRNADWRRIRIVSREIPEGAASATVMLYLTKGSSGKAYFDDVNIEPVVRDPVEFVFSSAYRNVQASGDVRFHAALYRPSDEPNAKAFFSYVDADGVVRRVAATREETDGATLSLRVADLKPGRNEVCCMLESAAGKVLGKAACMFERVAELPKRRVWIDEHKRCIVDGRPFFPIGMYSGKVEPEMLATYAEGPFNAIMPYQMTTREDLDLLQAKGIMGFVNLREGILGDRIARQKKFTRQEEVDAYFESEIRKVKDHPAMLAWYVNDERPGSEIADRIHLRGVFERVDPDHPTWGVLDRPFFLRGYLRSFDVAGIDPYPIGLKPISYVADHMHAAQHAVFGDLAFWNVPQTFAWKWFGTTKGNATKGFPSEAEIVNMNWQHIALGANGLIAYCFHSLKRDCDPAEAPECWSRICRAFEPVKRMIPVLLSVEPTPSVTGAPETMPVRTWMKDGALYVLAVNILDRDQRASLALAEGSWKVTATEVGLARTAAVSNGRLELELPPIGVALLRIQ